MESFDEEQVKKIAKLARIKFTDEDLQKLTKDLGKIWDIIEDLQSVDTSQVTPVSNVSVHPLPQREDEITDGNFPEKILSNTKHQNLNCFIVPKVIE